MMVYVLLFTDNIDDFTSFLGVYASKANAIEGAHKWFDQGEEERSQEETENGISIYTTDGEYYISARPVE